MLDKNIEYESIKKIAYSVVSNILKKIELFDVYIGENIPQNKKSFDFGINSFYKDLSNFYFSTSLK